MSSSLCKSLSIAQMAVRNTHRIASVTPQPSKNCFSISWDDGHQAQYPYVWLRDCANTRRIAHLDELSLGIAPDNHRVEGNKLVIDWPPYSANVPYDGEWLRKHDFGKFSEPPPPGPIDDYRAHPVLCDRAKTELNIDGAVLINGTVTDEHMSDMLDATHKKSVEYSVKNATPLHSGLAHWETIPKYAIIRITKPGQFGTYHLSDSQLTVDKLYAEQPHHYEMLLGVKALWQGAEGSARHPIIQVDHRDRVIMSVFDYSQRTSLLPLSNGRVRRYYAAMKAWYDECQAQTRKVAIVDTQTLIVDNHRTLFGKEAFGKDEKISVEYFD